MERNRTCATTYISKKHSFKALKNKGRGTLAQAIYGLSSLPRLFDDITERRISCCRTVTPNRRGTSLDLLASNEAVFSLEPEVT
jgi:hypothetical protein